MQYLSRLLSALQLMERTTLSAYQYSIPQNRVIASMGIAASYLTLVHACIRAPHRPALSIASADGMQNGVNGFGGLDLACVDVLTGHIYFRIPSTSLEEYDCRGRAATILYPCQPGSTLQLFRSYFPAPLPDAPWCAIRPNIPSSIRSGCMSC